MKTVNTINYVKLNVTTRSLLNLNENQVTSHLVQSHFNEKWVRTFDQSEGARQGRHQCERER